MKKKIFLLSLINIIALSGCNSKLSQNDQDKLNNLNQTFSLNEDFEDNEFSASELSYWLSYNKGKKEIEDSKIKILLTTEQFGGIRSVYKTSIDFSKEVYLNFKGFETANSNISLLLKMYFYDYSTKDSSYIISNDVIGLNGDFSINIDNALKRYGSSSSNIELYNGNELKFKNKKVLTSFYISAYNNTNSGLTNEQSWIKFESFNISYKDKKDIGELGSFSISQDGINIDNVSTSNVVTKKKNSEDVILKAKVNGNTVDNSKVIFATSDSRKLPISKSGVLTFADVTTDSERVVAYPREDISIGGFFDFPLKRFSKNSGFYVNVLGLWNKEEIYQNSIDLFKNSNVVSLDENLIDLFEGNLLNKQKLQVTNNLKAVTLVTSSTTVNVINNYSGSVEEKEEAISNNSSYCVSLLADAGLNNSNLNISVIAIQKETMSLMIKEQNVLDGSYSISLKYLNSDYSKFMENNKFLVLWDDGTKQYHSYFDTKIIDSNEIHKLSPTDIEKSFSADRGWDGLTTKVTTANNSEVFRINLELHDFTAFYAQPFIELYADKYSTKANEYIKIDFSRKVKLIFDFGDCFNLNYNLRFFRIGGRFVDEYWRDEGKYYTDLSMSNELLFIDLYHYANKGNIPNMINMSIAKSLPVELCFDISLKERENINANGYLDIKNMYILYE